MSGKDTQSAKGEQDGQNQSESRILRPRKLINYNEYSRSKETNKGMEVDTRSTRSAATKAKKMKNGNFSDTEAENAQEKTSRSIDVEKKRGITRKVNPVISEISTELDINKIESAKTVDKVQEEQPKSKENKGKNRKLNETATDYSKIDLNSNISLSGRECNLKISSWNVDGLRAWLKKGGAMFLEHENPDILCLQETKCAQSKIPSEAHFKGYHSYWVSSEKEGYAGVALFSKQKPINIENGIGIEEFDLEGRLITAEFKNFFLVTTYVPNAGKGLVNLPKRLEWDAAFRKYVKQLDEKKPVIICGDMNVSHEEIDLANPKTNTKNAGFTKEERDGMSQLLAQGFIDTFRHFYPKKTDAYTFWTYMQGSRSRNIGWRLDYFIVSERLIHEVGDSVIRNQILGSDHCPITLFSMQ